MEALKRVESALDALLETVRKDVAASEPAPEAGSRGVDASDLARVEAQLSDARSRVKQLETENTRLVCKYEEECNTIVALKEELSRTTEHSATLDAQLEVARSDAEIAKQRFRRATDELRDAERRTASDNQELQETKAKLAALRRSSKAGKAGKATKEWEKDVEELQKLLRNEQAMHEAEMERARFDLAAARAVAMELEELCTDGARLQLAMQEMSAVQRVVRYVEELQAEKQTKGRVVRDDVEQDLGVLANDALNEVSVRMADVSVAVVPILEHLGKRFAVPTCEQRDYEAVTQSRALACTLQKDVLSPTGIVGQMKNELAKFTDLCRTGRTVEVASKSVAMLDTLNRLTDDLKARMGPTMGRFLQVSFSLRCAQ